MSVVSRVARRVPDRFRAVASTVRAVVALARRQNLTYVAAGVAYYAFVSIIPLLLLVVAVSSVLGGDPLTDRVIALIGRQLSASGQRAVAEMLTDTAGRGTASLVGFVALAWSALRVFRGLDQGVRELYHDVPDSSLLVQFRNGIVVGTGLVLAITVVVFVDVVLPIPSVSVPFVGDLRRLGLLVVLAVVFVPIYYVLSPVDTSIRTVVPGAVVAAVGWVVLQIGFRLYAASASQYGAYGVLGALLLFVTWLYFASIVVLLGAAVNAVRQGARG
ncbi:MAG: YihY/virulence factor BrkB family protein [Halolamina sp.]